ncbi:hypothetical protein KEG38_34590, partial [Polyangium jinanense]|uniref:hypothetical protein n=1 Tax=Polyangium jinanense TaxID=2829994 RepID=UPI002341A5AB
MACSSTTTPTSCATAATATTATTAEKSGEEGVHASGDAGPAPGPGDVHEHFAPIGAPRESRLPCASKAPATVRGP